jgi:hypothetical protein
MLPMPGLAWQGKATLRMHEFRNPLAQVRSRPPFQRVPRFYLPYMELGRDSPLLDHPPLRTVRETFTSHGSSLY